MSRDALEQHEPGDAERIARVGWARVAEPEDKLAMRTIEAVGHVDAWRALAAGHRSLERFRARFEAGNPERDLQVAARLGLRVLVPSDDEWPPGLDDLGVAAPHCLFAKGAGHLRQTVERSVAVVGARAATTYGVEVTYQLARDLVLRGFTVVSGAAYGVDAAAARGALAQAGTTVAVLAGGAERPYPRENATLLEQVALRGVVFSESPPGSAPMRNRFLSRNRLIAAISHGTVVVEAGVRSGARATAHRAEALCRPVGAFPGPVTSPQSAGCHELIRDHGAVLVTDAAEVADLVGDLGSDAGAGRRTTPLPIDALDPECARVLAALRVSTPRTIDEVVQQAGLGLSAACEHLVALEGKGLAVSSAGQWRRASGSTT